MRAEQYGGNYYWAESYGHCVIYPGPYTFIEDGESSYCGKGQDAVNFSRFTASFNHGTYTWYLEN